MTIRITCAGCQRGIKAPESLAGKTAKCPGCGAKIVVPALTTNEANRPSAVSPLAPPALSPRQPTTPPPEPAAEPEDPFAYGVAPEVPRAGMARAPLPSEQSPKQQPPSSELDDPFADVLGPLSGSGGSGGDDPWGLMTARPSALVPPSPGFGNSAPGLGTSKPAGKPRSGYTPPPQFGANGHWAMGALLLCLVPLAIMLLSKQDDIETRVDRTFAESPDLQVEEKEDEDLDALQKLKQRVSLLTTKKLTDAHLALDSWGHWLYALGSAVFFMILIMLLFHPPDVTRMNLVTVGALTSTVGIIFLLMVQWIAIYASGWTLRSRNVVVMLVFWILWLIGFSYRAAIDPEYGFWMSFLGYTLGVGLCEELVKAGPVILRFRSEDQLSWQGACLWGLASGIGFGVAEGIVYSSDFYNGLGTWHIYYVRFFSCVALHAVWSGAVGIMVWQFRDQWNDVEWEDLLATLVAVLLVPMLLHGLYDTLLKKDYPAWAFLTALASFGWLYLLMYISGRDAQDEHLTKRMRARQRGLNGYSS